MQGIYYNFLGDYTMSDDTFTTKAAIFRKNWDLMKARHKRLKKLRGPGRFCGNAFCPRINNANLFFMQQMCFMKALFTATMLDTMADDMFF